MPPSVIFPHQFEAMWSKVVAPTRAFALRTIGRDEPVATLRWAKTYGSLATLTLDDGSVFTVKRTGFWSPRVTFRTPSCEDDLEVFTPTSWSAGGQLRRVVDGSTHFLARESLWGSRWIWSASNAVPIMAIDMTQTACRGEIRLAPDLAWNSRSVTLASMGWYVMQLLAEDEQTAMTAAVTATICAASG